jgi:enoyl-CoA hydratase/carnithine racemase
MADERVNYKVDGHIATITFNRPPVNALTHKDLDVLIDRLQEADQDDNVRAIVITGNGDKYFCAGVDVNISLAGGDEKKKTSPEFVAQNKDELLSKNYSSGYQLWSPEEKLRETVRRFLMEGFPIHHIEVLLNINTPTIAAVNGAASGLGFEIACSCDMRIVSEQARFRCPFVGTQGAVPEIAYWLLPRLVGLAKANELILISEIIDAKEADKIGLVNKVVPHDQLMSVTMEMATKLANQPPLAVKLAKEGIRWGLGLPMEKKKRWGNLAWQFCMGTEDHKEAAKAFLEKRPGVYKGK